MSHSSNTIDFKSFGHPRLCEVCLQTSFEVLNSLKDWTKFMIIYKIIICVYFS